MIFPKDTKLRKHHQRLFSVIQQEELGLFLKELYGSKLHVVCLRNEQKVQLHLGAHWGKVTVVGGKLRV